MLKGELLKLGANFGKKYGPDILLDFGDPRKELGHMRSTVALSDFSFAKIFSFPEGDGAEYLDAVLPANIFKLRYGRIINTFLSDSSGNVSGELMLANIDDRLWAIVETSDAESCKQLVSGGGGCEVSSEYCLFSIDGPLAWKAAENLFGADVLGLAYMSVDKFAFQNSELYLLRNGRTGEFGYQIMAPVDESLALFEALKDSVMSLGGACAGFDAHTSARLQGNFFNFFREGVRVRNPLELGLQWMVDFSKDKFLGSEALFESRKAGVKRRLTAISSERSIADDSAVYCSGREIGRIVSAIDFENGSLALALMDADYAYPGFAYSSKPDADDESLNTVSRPTLIPLSLTKGMDE